MNPHDLDQARQSLDDARLLAEHRRANEVVLTRLALHQALQALSRAQGLDADDETGLETLLRRVPREHKQAVAIAALREPAAQTIAGVAALIAALAEPDPTPRRPEAAPDRAATPSPAPGPARSPDLSGPTALSLSPAHRGPAGTADGVSGTAFWNLMDRWRIGDLAALDLIGHAGGLTRKGTRPRFRLEGDEAARYALLRRLDTALADQRLDPHDWLTTRRKPAPFNGGSALDVLTETGVAGADALLHTLTLEGLKAAMSGRPGPSGHPP